MKCGQSGIWIAHVIVFFWKIASIRLRQNTIQFQAKVIRDPTGPMMWRFFWMCAHEAPVRDVDPNAQKNYHETRRSLLSSKYIPMRPIPPYMEAGMRLKLFQSLGGFGTYRHSRDWPNPNPVLVWSHQRLASITDLLKPTCLSQSMSEDLLYL